MTPRPSSVSAADVAESIADRATSRPDRMTFRTKLVTSVCALVLLTGAIVTWLAHRSARASTEVLTDSLFREVSDRVATHTRSFVLRAAPLVDSLLHLADAGLTLDDSDQLARQLLAFQEGNPGLSWISYGDASGTFTGVYRTPEGGLRINQSRIQNGKTQLVEHDVLTNGDWKLFRRVDDSGYDPRQRPYYTAAREKGRLVWLPPYVFYNQGVPGISCAAPVKDKSGSLRGVLSVDFDLRALSDFISELRVSPHSTVFLFTDDQTLLAHPRMKRVASGGEKGEGRLYSLADTGDPLVDDFRKHLSHENPSHVGSGSGGTKSADSFRFFAMHHDGDEYFASTTKFRVGDDLNWVVGAIAPRSDFLRDVWKSQTWAFIASGMALLAGVLISAALARRVSRPVESLIGFMQRIGAGDLEARAAFRGSAEFRQLSAALNRMIDDLRDRLRLRHSLNIAMEVQQRLLPAQAPRVAGLDIAGHSTYCDETGGDYYDFVTLEESASGRLLVALGDVMGHGVAAALVMAGVRAVLRDRAATAGGLAELMERLNRMMVSDLEGSRFMTMHLSVVDAAAGTFRWVSAGHDPAILYDPVSDRFEEIDESGLPLGITEDSDYQEVAYPSLKPGHVIVIGTDGVWEMQNAAGEMYGKERLRTAIRASATKSANEILETIRAGLLVFRGAHQAIDDVTFVVIRIAARKDVGAPRSSDPPSN